MSEFKSGFFVGGESCNGRVLVVDDEPDAAESLREFFMLLGMDCRVAFNGQDAVAIALTPVTM